MRRASLIHLLYRWLWAVLCIAAHGGALAAEAGEGDAWAGRSDAVFSRVLSEALSVTDLVQDKDGFLWVATQSGLGRWDGYQLRRYAGDIGTPGALPDSYVLTLAVDGSGGLWVGTSAGGLVRYDAATDRFVSPLAGDAALTRNSVFAMLDDGQGGLWVGTGGGLDHLDPLRGTVVRHAAGARTRGLPDRSVQALLRDAGGALWVGTDQGLFRLAAGAERFERVSLPSSEAGEPFVAYLRLDDGQRVWAGTRSHGAFVLEPGSVDAVPLHRLVGGARAGLARAAIRGMTLGAPGEVWLGTDGEGIDRVDTRQWQLRHVRHQARGAASLPDDDVSALYRDRSGLVWVGTDSGLSYHDVRQAGISTWLGGTGDERGIHHPNVPFVLPRPDGRVWLSVGDGGIDVVQPELGVVARLRPEASSPQSALPPGRVLCMVSAPSGEVYIGTQRGLYKADADGRVVRRLEVPGRAPTASIWAMAMQGTRLWFGGLDGLWGVDPVGTAGLQVAVREDGTRLGEQRITALLQADAGTLWVGTRSGVVRLDTATLSVSRPFAPGAGANGLPTGYVSSMLLDRRGRLWASFFGAGVRVVELSASTSASASAVHRLTRAQGLPHDGVNALVMDAGGDVWASTDAGLARIAAGTLEVRAFDASDGVGVPTYWTSAGAAMPDGHLLFGGGGGLTIVDPRRVDAERPSAPLVVTELRLGEEAALPGYLTSGSARAPLAIGSGRRSVLAEFAVLDYTSPGRNRYQYRLRGIDRDWIGTDPKRRIAAYTNLPVGDYVLELRGAGAHGSWSRTLELPLRVLPAWHETVWFRAAAALAAVGLLAALVQGRTVYLRRRQRALEALVAERTTALEQRTLELQQSQQQLEKIAYFDGLTGLANRRMFNDEARRMLAQARRDGSGLCLLLIDLDHFKQINDTLGHQTGDAVLAAIGNRLGTAVRESDRVARLGGDEFAVLLPGTTSNAGVRQVCDRILARIAAPPSDEAVPLLPGISIGAACFPRDAADVDGLYKAADIALYDAKHAGRGRCSFYSETQPVPVEAG
ncbi:diguanylate cyclase domain-containing protein [Ideonella sp. YS5]|uniref:diguanylate cyclase domain-containing protein n=1 Tax=Ideonella sp. YS5 TaxID=3453714 RepID=UPI003EE8225D